MSTPFIVHTAAKWLELAAMAPKRVSLYENLWYENDFACVLGDNAAESADRALRIAETVADTRRVLFIDLRGSFHSFAERCRVRAPRNLLRVNIDLADIDPADIDGFLRNIERTVADTAARVCVIDSLFWLCEWRGKAGGARFFIMKLREMGRRLGISILIGTTARKRVGKGTAPSDEHLPKGTAPFIDAILPAPETTEKSAESHESEKPGESELSEQSGASEKLSRRLSHPGRMPNPSPKNNYAASGKQPRIP